MVHSEEILERMLGFIHGHQRKYPKYLPSYLIKGTHSFRRNAITKVVNNTGGNVVLASQLFGNSPDVALKHYFTKADAEQARKALEA